MNYQVKTNVYFDMCSLEGHDWVKDSNWGLANLTEMQRCTKCGATYFPRLSSLGGINRSTGAIWTNHQRLM